MRKLKYILVCALLMCGCHKNSSSITSNSSSNNSSNEKTSSVEETPAYTYEVIADNGWESNNEYFQQYHIKIHANEKIDDWKLEFSVPDTTTLSQSWNGTFTSNGNNWTITPVDYNKSIEANSDYSDIGFIASCKSQDKIEVNTNVASNTKVVEEEKEVIKSEAVVPTSVSKLHVDGTKLMNENNEVVQLKGVSTHGIAWYPQFVNEEAIKTLKNDWGANVFRIAMYTSEYGGYCSGGNQEELKSIIDNGVKWCSDNDMYVIIDWHILSDNNPTTYQNEARDFFNEMSSKYKDYNNVLYEICNEPQNVSWHDTIKPYAEDIINTIRSNDNDAIVLVGTNTWSQDVDDVIGDKIDDNNVMYDLHFYAATHTDNIRNKLVNAINNGVPVFVSECSICDASGNGGVDYDSANAWLNLMNENSVSFIAWSLSNKDESSALINASCDKTSGWSYDDLSDTGKWYYDAIKG